MIPFRLPVIVPFRLPVIVPFRLPVIVPFRLPVIVPANVTVAANMMMSPVPANFLSDFISISPGERFVLLGLRDGEPTLLKLPLHPANNTASTVWFYNTYAKNKLDARAPQSL